ncbi:CDP-diacylglycerol--glycerol-3-phosphate 3-phosphatidyltransferase [Luteolibacter pohnpeiensis]|uniref:CDP-diacylglycerol--glycerol-3-phosphate 3-phosphatidyltransferase n=1 Tax=Luteolibacter pohnpeiensis TaxID=454153 RepID=A0A934SB05_9BACT|nr:CDP-diacylglycerol--glycerol-3-phosphate 3-phosphatidyltransferase [Luteolibacter pohnpeiensis]MBK1882882.1 CDP-diacylglycerol--glycerol-3-phosphate 3-phosphatidyltransferase [Luteolibacter pohnpeiensis]
MKFRVSQAHRLCFIQGVTLASKITLLRLLLVPVFGYLAVRYGHSVDAGNASESTRWAALAVFVTASASDGLDGWIARRFNQKSKFGAFIDPIADKSLLLTAVITLSLVDWGPDGWRLPIWFPMLLILRDCVILGGITILYFLRSRVKIAPHWSGKVCTVTQMFAIGWVMLKVVPFSPIYPCLVAAVFTVWSTVAYVRRGIEILRTDPTSAA